MNPVEIWLGVLTRQAIRRGAFVSVPHLIRRIKEYTAHWNTSAKPFAWTATAEEIIEKVRILKRDFRQLLDSNQNRK